MSSKLKKNLNVYFSYSILHEIKNLHTSKKLIHYLFNIFNLNFICRLTSYNEKITWIKLKYIQGVPIVSLLFQLSKFGFYLIKPIISILIWKASLCLQNYNFVGWFLKIFSRTKIISGTKVVSFYSLKYLGILHFSH